MRSGSLSPAPKGSDLPNGVPVAVLVSGGGSNLQAILDAQMQNTLGDVRVVQVVASKPGIPALDRAKKAGVDTVVAETQDAVLHALNQSHVQVICLAGYLKKLSPAIVQRFRGKILNIHPALLPKYGGAGMYGHYVHEAVLAAGEKESGCTVHVVDEEYDRGPILAQAKVSVLPNDTPESLAARILEQEHQLYPKTLKEFCEKLR